MHELPGAVVVPRWHQRSDLRRKLEALPETPVSESTKYPHQGAIECPTHDDELMEQRYIQGIQLDLCAEGDGIWLDRDEPRKKKHSLQAKDMPLIKKTKLISFELYNIKDDLAQENDLAKANPERTAKLAKVMSALLDDTLEEGPSWAFERK